MVEIHMESNVGDNKLNNLEKNVALSAKGRRSMVRDARRAHKIAVVKPKSNLHIVLAIVCGIIIGLIATSLLVLAGGRLF